MEKKAARAGVFFNTDVMRRSRMQLAFLEHTRVRTVREIFASSGCKSAGALRFSGIKMYSGECRFNCTHISHTSFMHCHLSHIPPLFCSHRYKL